MTITIISSNGEKEIKQVINTQANINQTIANDIAYDLYGGNVKSVVVR